MPNESVKSHIARIERHCEQLNIPTENKAVETLADYTEEMILWNRRINLTGAKTAEQFIDGPLFDAMTLVPVIVETPSFVDIGSGGGLPGIPMMLLTRAEPVTLVEPRSKRATFLRHITAKLGLETVVEESRIEALHPRKWAAAVTQAVFAPEQWINLAPQYLEPGGFIYVLASTRLEQMPMGIETGAMAQFRNPRGSTRFSYRLMINNNESTTPRH